AVRFPKGPTKPEHKTPRSPRQRPPNTQRNLFVGRISIGKAIGELKPPPGTSSVAQEVEADGIEELRQHLPRREMPDFADGTEKDAVVDFVEACSVVLQAVDAPDPLAAFGDLAVGVEGQRR